MEIYKLTPEDWEIYKKLRLEALQNDRKAFGSSYAESLNKTDEKWKEEISNPRSHILAMREGDDYIGMAAAYQEEGEKIYHIAFIWGVYVRDDHRRQGIGRQLMEAVLSELQSIGEIKKVNLNVNAELIAAVKLYESLGFRVAGTLHMELKIGKNYYDEYVMEKIF